MSLKGLGDIICILQKPSSPALGGGELSMVLKCSDKAEPTLLLLYAGPCKTMPLRVLSNFKLHLPFKIT